MAGKLRVEDDPPPMILDAVCDLIGHPQLKNVLVRAQASWKTEPIDSYRIMRNSLPSFPSDRADLMGLLSDFYYHSLFTLPRKTADDFAAFLCNLDLQHQAKNSLEHLMLLRVLCLFDEQILPPGELRQHWGHFIQLHEKIHGVNLRLASLAYEWLGEAQAVPSKSSNFFGFRRSKAHLRDVHGAIEALNKSIKLDPDNRKAHLTLAQVYKVTGAASNYNRLLDQIIKRFPDDKATLLMAAEGCVARKAFSKGLAYLERARHLDPLDPAIPDLLVSARYFLIRQRYQKGRIPEARKLMDETRPWFADQANNLIRAKWCATVRWGLLEKLHGEPRQGAELLARARAASPFPTAFLFFAHVMHSIYTDFRIREDLGLSGEFRASMRTSASVGDARLLFKIYDYGLQGRSGRSLGDAFRLLSDYLKNAFKHPFGREEAVDLVESAIAARRLVANLRPLVRKVLKQDGRDPRFRLYQWEINRFGNAFRSPDLAELRSILQEATTRGDHATVKKAQPILNRFSTPTPSPFNIPPGEMDDDVDEEDGFDDEAVLDEIMNQAEKEFGDRRKGSRRKTGRTDFAPLIDAMAKAMKSMGQGSSSASSRPSPISKPEPTPVQPPSPPVAEGQLDLFNP